MNRNARSFAFLAARSRKKSTIVMLITADPLDILYQIWQDTPEDPINKDGAW
jgi:hypothetical protein